MANKNNDEFVNIVDEDLSYTVPSALAGMAKSHINAGEPVTAINAPAWTLMPSEAEAARKLIMDVFKGMTLTENQMEELFVKLPKRLAASCKKGALKGAGNACSEALNVVYRFYKRKIEELDFVDKLLLDRLDQVLVELCSAPKVSFDRMMTPKFTVEATNALNAMPDLREILVNDARSSIAAEIDSKIFAESSSRFARKLAIT